VNSRAARLAPIVLGGAGLGVIVLLTLHHDAAAIADGVGAVGGVGMICLAAARVLPLTICAAAWRSLGPSVASYRAFVWFRSTRDAAGDLLAFMPLAGELAAIGMMVRHGIRWNVAAALLVADLTAEIGGQLFFTLVAIDLLGATMPDASLLGAASIGAGVLAAVIGSFLAVQRWGVGRLLAALARRMLPSLAHRTASSFSGIDTGLRAIYADGRRVSVGVSCHVVAWFAGVSEAALALWLMNDWRGLRVVLVLEGLIFALRTTAFCVPSALGVQEAGYVYLGAAFGFGAETMMALSLLKRARELMVGAPVLIVAHFAGAGTFAVRRANAVPER
jgi:putative membrane protein